MANEASSAAASKARAEDMPETARGIEELQAQMKALKDDLAAIRSTLTGVAGASMREGRAKAEETAERYKRMGMEQADLAMEGARAYGEALEGQITRNPFSAVLVALGLGFLVGLMSRR